MEPAQRVVISTPLAELWDTSGPIEATRSRDLTLEEVRQLIQDGPIRFVVAEPGSPLRWISADERFSFWKSDVRSHLANYGRAAWPETFPDSYCYLASEWKTGSGPPIIVLEIKL